MHALRGNLDRCDSFRISLLECGGAGGSNWAALAAAGSTGSESALFEMPDVLELDESHELCVAFGGHHQRLPPPRYLARSRLHAADHRVYPRRRTRSGPKSRNAGTG